MPSKFEKTWFMLGKLRKDIFRKKIIYELASEVHSSKLSEYYFVMDEQKLRAGYSQNFHFDEEGIPLIPTYIDVDERKLIYYPISIGQFGLAIYHTYLQSGSEADKQRFLNIVDWFYNHRIEDERLGTYWLTDVPKPEYRVFQPWPSAFAQSRGLSILLRGWQITGEKKYLNTAKGALKIYHIPAAEGGVTTFTESGPMYEEYPAPFLTAVLDGAIFSLFGLYDFVRAVDDNQEARQLFDDGIRGLKGNLPKYDLGFWIRYNLCNETFYPEIDPAPILYFRLVMTQLDLLTRITGDNYFSELAQHWRRYDRLPNILRMYYLKYKALKKLNRL